MIIFLIGIFNASIWADYHLKIHGMQKIICLILYKIGLRKALVGGHGLLIYALISVTIIRDFETEGRNNLAIAVNWKRKTESGGNIKRNAHTDGCYREWWKSWKWSNDG